MLRRGSVKPVEAAVPAANFGDTQATRLPLQHTKVNAFTLAELVVSVGVLVLLVVLATQLLNSTATVTTLAQKQMDADTQTRQLLDRMAIDFTQMVKRSDVDYYVKSSWFATGSPPGPTGVRNLLQAGNDTIAFYSTVPGYYPSTGSASPLSLVARTPPTLIRPTSSSSKVKSDTGFTLRWAAILFTPMVPPVCLPTQDVRWMCSARSLRK
jgi:hypothetical protein